MINTKNVTIHPKQNNFDSYLTKIIGVLIGCKYQKPPKNSHLCRNSNINFVELFHCFPIFVGRTSRTYILLYNNDLQTHEVTVEVFGSHNESVFKEKYELAPKEYIVQPKSSCLLLQWLMPWPKGARGSMNLKFL